MNMKYKNKYNLPDEFADLFDTLTEEDQIEIDAQMLSFKFLEAVEKHCEPKKLKKKEIAEAIGKSQSFISQVYSGDKLLNMTLLAKLQKAFNITFDIKAAQNSLNYDFSDLSDLPDIDKKPKGYWVWKNIETNDAVYKDYSISDNIKLINNNYSSAG